MTERFVVGVAFPSRGIVVFPSATMITEENGGYVGKNVEYQDALKEIKNGK